MMRNREIVLEYINRQKQETMEAKRAKLESDDSNSKDSVDVQDAATRHPIITSEQLKTANDQDLLKLMSQLKQRLTKKARIQEFIRNPTIFVTVMEIAGKKVDAISDESKHTLLKEVVGVLANCCYYSLPACLELKRAHHGFSVFASKILNSEHSPTDLIFSTVRLIANMCSHKESALFICTSPVLEKVVSFLDSPDLSTIKQTLRCIRSLLTCSFSRALLKVNACFYIGKLLTKEETSSFHTEAFQILTRFCGRFVRDIGRQLATSECVDLLNYIFFHDPDEKKKLFILELCKHSSDIRNRFGEANAINTLVQLRNLSHLQCRLLASFSQDAWGRASLRESGALDILIERFASNDSEVDEKLSIVNSFKHFVHDTVGMAHLAHSRIFVDAVASDIREFINRNKVDCEVAIEKEDDIYRPDSPLLMEIETSFRGRQTNGDEEIRLHKDYKDYLPAWSNVSSPASSSWSSFSPISSGAASPVQSSVNNSPISSPTGDPGSYFPTDMEDSNQGNESTPKFNQIVDIELSLVVHQAQEDSSITYLIREDIVVCLIDYLSLIPRGDSRARRALLRMAQSRVSIDSLLEMEFHTRILNSLYSVPCRMTRYAKACSRCEKCVNIGREILREFSSHVDSSFGYSFLIQRLKNDDFLERTKAVIAHVTLVKNHVRILRPVSSLGDVNPLSAIYNSLTTIMNDQSLFEKTAYEGGPALTSQLIGALSTQIALNRVREIFELDAAYVPLSRVPCQLRNNRKISDEENLKFQLEDGTLIAEIPLKDAFQSSEYFRGMFTSNLSEKVQNVRCFIIDPSTENCGDAEVFRKFLHYLAGCRDHCSRANSAEDCAGLLQLSSHYMCLSLSEDLCSPHGAALRFLSGESVHLFLPHAIVTVDFHRRLLAACLMTLMRFCSTSQIIEAVSSIRESDILRKAFIDELRQFITSNH